MKALEAIGQVLWAMLLTCGVLVLAYWSTRHIAGHMTLRRKMGGRMEVLDQLPLGRDQRLVLARVGQRVYLLGLRPVQSRGPAETAERRSGSERRCAGYWSSADRKEAGS